MRYFPVVLIKLINWIRSPSENAMKTHEKWSPPLNTEWAKWKKKTAKVWERRDRKNNRKKTKSFSFCAHCIVSSGQNTKKHHPKNTLFLFRLYSWCCCSECWQVRQSIESTFTRSIFRDKNKENDEELTKRNRERESETQQTKSVYTIFFLAAGCSVAKWTKSY